MTQQTSSDVEQGPRKKLSSTRRPSLPWAFTSLGVWEKGLPWAQRGGFSTPFSLLGGGGDEYGLSGRWDAMTYRPSCEGVSHIILASAS